MATKRKDENEELLAALVAAINKQTEAIQYQTKAIRYLADVAGFKGDDLNDGSVRIEGDEQVQQLYALNDIKAILNTFARQHGKDKALALVEKYAGSRKIEDINASDYEAIAKEVGP